MKEMTAYGSKNPTLVPEKRIVWMSFLVSGYSNMVSQTEMGTHLSRLGYKVHLFLMGPKNGFSENSGMRFVFFRVKFIPMITPLMYTAAMLIFMPLYVLVTKPDYIIVEKGTAIIGFALKLFLRPLRFKTVLDVRTTPIRARGTFRENLNMLLFRISVELAKKNFDGITILTELMKKDFCSRYHVTPEFVGVWTSGVSATLFDPQGYNRTEIRKKLNLDDKFIVFHHGALSVARGLAETIKSIGILKNQYKDLVLFFLGSDWGVQRLKILAGQSGVFDRLVLHDAVAYTEVPKYIAICDVAIIPLPNSPNWRFQCPLKLLEYLAMEKVVIATDIPANREVIGNSECGIYVKSTNPEEIAKSISYAYDNKTNLVKWGKLGRDIIEKDYTWEKVAEAFDGYLSSL